MVLGLAYWFENSHLVLALQEFDDQGGVVLDELRISLKELKKELDNLEAS